VGPPFCRLLLLCRFSQFGKLLRFNTLGTFCVTCQDFSRSRDRKFEALGGASASAFRARSRSR
jgi:hypothetical protein